MSFPACVRAKEMLPSSVCAVHAGADTNRDRTLSALPGAGSVSPAAKCCCWRRPHSSITRATRMLPYTRTIGKTTSSKFACFARLRKGKRLPSATTLRCTKCLERSGATGCGRDGYAACPLVRLSVRASRHALAAACDRNINRRRQGFKCGCPRCSAKSDPVDALLSGARAPGTEALEAKFERSAAVAEAATSAAMRVMHADAPSPGAAAPHRAAAAAGLAEARAELRGMLGEAEGKLQMTHWRMQQTLKLMCMCLWLEHSAFPREHAPADTATFDPDLGFSDAANIAQLRRFLHVALAAEAATSPALHPMRLELYGIWLALPRSGDEWKTAGVFDDLDRLWALWERGDETALEHS